MLTKLLLIITFSLTAIINCLAQLIIQDDCFLSYTIPALYTIQFPIIISNTTSLYAFQTATETLTSLVQTKRNNMRVDH